MAGGGRGGGLVRADRVVASDVRPGMTLLMIGALTAGELVKPIAIAVLMFGIVLAASMANRRR